MARNRRGTNAATSMPVERDIPKSSTNSTNFNMISIISLLLFAVFTILLLVGVYIRNDFLTFFSLGIGVSVSIYYLSTNLREEEESEIWQK